MKYRQLEVFHAVMMHGTLTKAAEKLGVSQPSVTSTLKHAEADVGVPLYALARIDAPTYEAEHVPAALAAIPAVKPGSRGLR